MIFKCATCTVFMWTVPSSATATRYDLVAKRNHVQMLRSPSQIRTHPLCLELVCEQPSVWQWITVHFSNWSMLLQSRLPSEIWSSTVTSPPSVWQSTSPPPACYRPCTHKPQSQKAPDQPGPESRSRLRAAPWSLWTIRTPASRSEATSPSAVGSLGSR